jgi:hypothetical protein
MAKISGRCACGKVTYETDAEPLRMVNCHCRDCQRASGSAFAAIVAFQRDQVRFTGDLAYYTTTSERATTLERGFCPNCGSPMTISPEVRPDRILILAASLDDPTLHKPIANIWVRSAPPWDHLDPTVPRFEKAAPQ